jgi:hypothetical protein
MVARKRSRIPRGPPVNGSSERTLRRSPRGHSEGTLIGTTLVLAVPARTVPMDIESKFIHHGIFYGPAVVRKGRRRRRMI